MLTTTTMLHGLIFGLIFNGYIFLMMITTSPRVWGYQDYSERVKAKVPPQTRRERTTAGLFGIPFMAIVLGFPAYSLNALKASLGGEVSFTVAFVHLVVLAACAFLGDLVVLDWLIISKITPDFVIIPGSTEEDYKDFSHHFRGHARASVILVVLCGIVAWIYTSM